MTDILNFSAVIPSAGTKSPAVFIGNYFITGVEIPASMTGTALTFEVGLTDTTVPLRNTDNTVFTITIDNTAAAYALDANLTAGITYIKVVSGSTEGAERIIKLSGYRI